MLSAARRRGHHAIVAGMTQAVGAPRGRCQRWRGRQATRRYYQLHYSRVYYALAPGFMAMTA